MSDEHFRQYIQVIEKQMADLQSYVMQSAPQQKVAEALEEIAAALGNIQISYEQMQTSLEASAVISHELFLANQQAIAQTQRYYDLFQYCPDGYIETDPNGIIKEANVAIALMLDVSPNYLIAKPLAIFIPQIDRQAFRTKLNQLPYVSDAQINWEIKLCPKKSEPFAAQLNVAIVRDDSGWIEALRITVRDISSYKQPVAQPAQLIQQNAQAQTTTFVARSLPPSLDGLQVLVVDDEADAREFITAVLESHGICVTAVATAAAALEVLEKFRPDVLVSDIRMPDQNGYSLIRRLRELEAEKGWHIPAAALTAYLVEDREKAITAGFTSHLHKLAQPTELVEMVARLARRSPTT